MEPQASQSQDCEATPPLQRHNSNFYLPPMDGGGDSPRHNMRMYHTRHSPHARQRCVVETFFHLDCAEFNFHFKSTEDSKYLEDTIQTRYLPINRK